MVTEDTIRRIEIQIEGRAEDGGAVRLDVLYNILHELKNTLSAVERQLTENDRSVVAFKVTTLSYSSPIRCVVEPIPNRSQPSLGERVTKEFVDVYEGIASGQSIAVRDPYVLEQFDRFAAKRKQVGNISVGPENGSVALPIDFTDKLRKLLGNVYRTRGSYRGTLEAVNIHSSPCVVYIYPIIGPTKVRGIYPRSRFPQIGDYLGKSVDVFGVLKFRGDEPHPYEIEIEDISALSRGTKSIADDLVGSMPDLTDGKDITSYLDDLRNE